MIDPLNILRHGDERPRLMNAYMTCLDRFSATKSGKQARQRNCEALTEGFEYDMCIDRGTFKGNVERNTAHEWQGSRLLDI